MSMRNLHPVIARRPEYSEGRIPPVESPVLGFATSIPRHCPAHLEQYPRRHHGNYKSRNNANEVGADTQTRSRF